jgi:hypothetical protein
VEGFPSAKPASSQTGQRLLGTARRMQQGEGGLRELVISLTGIPGPGPARWVAAAIAAAIAIGGLGFAWQNRGAGAGRVPPVGKVDAEHARDLLLTELVALETAHSQRRIGPRTYESARRSLLDALVRLEAALGSLTREGTYREAPG